MRFKINPGELRHWIEIKSNIETEDDDNIPVSNNLDTILKTKAKVLNVRGEEFYKAQGVGSKVEKTFYIRYPRGLTITKKDSILYNSTLYNIIYINDIEERGLYLEIKCEVIE